MTTIRLGRFTAVLIAAALVASGCSETRSAEKDFSSCAAYKPAFEITDRFMQAFNAKDMAGLEKTFHFPHIRLSEYPIHVLTAPGQQEDVFGLLKDEGWSRSDWAHRHIIQCSPTKAHMLATFERFKADGTQYASYEGLYVIELRDGYWGITMRSTFAP